MRGRTLMLNPNGIDPSPENQLFATAQRDFLPSPVGRGLRSGIPTWYADVVAMILLFLPLLGKARWGLEPSIAYESGLTPSTVQNRSRYWI